MPITWEPGAYGRLLSTIEADLKLTGLAGHRTRAALSGRYLVASASSTSDLMAARRVADSLFADLLEHLETTFRGRPSAPTQLKVHKANRASAETPGVVGARDLWRAGTGPSALVGATLGADHGIRVRGSRAT